MKWMGGAVTIVVGIEAIHATMQSFVAIPSSQQKNYANFKISEITFPSFTHRSNSLAISTLFFLSH